ncbi:MAG: response regulator [Desulfobacterales bacterium]|nr:response regulator [Desulfobacterales bacterium]
MAITQLLIVDDEERFLKTTKFLLENKECEVFTATDGLSAMEILKNERLDVVILDVKMPGLDGVEVLRRIKQKHPLLEVIMLTGHSTTESAVEGLKLGAFDYLMKPCDIPVLLEKVKEAHDKRLAMEEKIRQVKIDKIISHPLEVFEKD